MVPREQRQYGYFVMPVLHGDRLVGRVDPEFDRKRKVLRIHAIHWEADPTNIDRPGGRHIGVTAKDGTLFQASVTSPGDRRWSPGRNQ